jgi:hypothetical protein
MNKRVVALVVVVTLVAASISYYEYSSYESTVLQTTVVMGVITNIAGSLPSSPGSTAVSGESLVTISIGSDSFQRIVPCSPLPIGYNIGTTIQVADQLLRSGQHQYYPDIACKGGASPFNSALPHIDAPCDADHAGQNGCEA